MFRKKQKPQHLPQDHRFLSHKPNSGAPATVSDEVIPRITNETIEVHRDEVLRGARKFIYPLQHSKHKIVIFSVTIIVAAIIGFMSYVTLGLYRWQYTSDFMYQITKVLPLPVARIGGTFVAYENYLFELRHYIHYFDTQQDVDFASAQGRAQLAEQRKKSIESVVNYAYVKKIARQKNITVSAKEVDAQVAMLRSQNKLGSDNKVFENILKDYWGWSIGDFRRSIEQEILTSKVLQALDVKTKTTADDVLAQIKAGKDFAALAKQYSNDPATKDRGGEIGFLITKNDQNLPSQTLDALSKLKAGEVSGVINLGYGLEIIKNLGDQDGKTKAAIIVLTFKDISYYLNDYKDKQKAQVFIKA